MKMRVYEVEVFPVLELGEFGDGGVELGGTVIEVTEQELERYKLYLEEYGFWQFLLNERVAKSEKSAA
jgi:hypothetical protein